MAMMFAEHDAHEVGRVPRAKLLHDARPMHLDGPRGDAEMAAGRLAGRAGHDLRQHFAFAPRQDSHPGKRS